MFVYKHTETKEYVKKLAYFLRKIQTLRVNNSGIPTIKNTKFSIHYFYINLNIWEDFQISLVYLQRSLKYLKQIIKSIVTSDSWDVSRKDHSYFHKICSNSFRINCFLICIKEHCLRPIKSRTSD